MRMPPSFRALLLSSLLVPCVAQDRPASPLIDPKPHHVVRRFPQDKDAPIAVVGSRTLTLGDLVEHLESRHYPGLSKALRELPTMQAMLQSDLVAPWVRHFADLEALRQAAEAGIDEAKLKEAQSAALKRNFEAWLATYAKDQEAAGRKLELTQHKINSLLTTFQLHNGLAAELQGFLDYLEPGDYNRTQLNTFFNANARVFGGQVTISHILVQHRDSGTGILLNEEGVGRANERLASIKASIAPDGSNFEEVARARSEDARTAKDGGRLQGLHRYDDRLPAALCRAAWALKDGEISDVVETQYGFHLIKRLEFAQQVFMLFTDDAMPTIKSVMQRARQEEHLFGARAKASVRLML
jgi:parvulin-like peptidyl-prolyl isomerase